MNPRFRAAAASRNPPALESLDERVGVCQWFHYNDYRAVEAAVPLLEELGIKHLRTGISWADWHRPDGPAWTAWMLERLAPRFELLVSIWHTPPSISENKRSNGPPCDLWDYPNFLAQVCQDLGHLFAAVEIWNEPNNHLKWDFITCDPGWNKFDTLLIRSAQTLKQFGKTAVLGGVALHDETWIASRLKKDTDRAIEVVGFHAFPGMWSPHERYNWEYISEWTDWATVCKEVRGVVEGREVWVTETGYATLDEDLWMKTGDSVRSRTAARKRSQIDYLLEALAAPCDRIYWYSLFDLPIDRPALPEQISGERNEWEHYMGLIDHFRKKKPAFMEMRRLLAQCRSRL